MIADKTEVAALIHGTPEWYDREIEGALAQRATAQMQVIRAETALAIFTQERALAAARIGSAQTDEEAEYAGDGQHGGDSTG